MRTIVVQLYEHEHTPDRWNKTHTMNIIPTCVASVDHWAKQNNFDYKKYTSEDLKEKRPKNFDKLNAQRYETFNDICLDKLLLFDQPEYDRVVQIDADVLVWGNPSIDESPFCVLVEGRDIIKKDQVANTMSFPFPQGGVIWTTLHLDLYNYYHTLCENLHEETLFTYIKLAKTYHPEMFRGGELGITDEDIISIWLHENEVSWTEMGSTKHVLWSTTKLYRRDSLPDEDSFIHFAGNEKVNNFERFKMLSALKKINSMWKTHILDRAYAESGRP